MPVLRAKFFAAAPALRVGNLAPKAPKHGCKNAPIVLVRCTGTPTNRANITLRHKWHTNALILSLMIRNQHINPQGLQAACCN